MIEPRERKRLTPGDGVAEPVAEEDADPTQPVEHQAVEQLSHDEQHAAGRQRHPVVRRRQGPGSVQIAPAGEDRVLQRLEGDEERANDDDRLT